MLKTKPFRKLKELNMDEVYPVVNINIMNSQFGPQVVVESDTFKVSLPNRFLNLFTEEKIDYLKNFNLKFKYVGLINDKYTSVEFITE